MCVRTGSDEASALSVAPPANVLLQAPALSRGDMDVCPSVTDHPGRQLLQVTFAGKPAARLEMWQAPDTLPQIIALLTTAGSGLLDDLNDPTDPEATTDTIASDCDVPISQTTLSEPSDLTGIGIYINTCFAAWAETATGIDVCFDSLTTLVQAVDIRSAHRFLTLLGTRVRNVAATAPFSIGLYAHDAQCLSTVATEFSDVSSFNTAANESTPKPATRSAQ